jgi:hypothetical protein
VAGELGRRRRSKSQQRRNDACAECSVQIHRRSRLLQEKRRHAFCRIRGPGERRSRRPAEAQSRAPPASLSIRPRMLIQSRHRGLGSQIISLMKRAIRPRACRTSTSDLDFKRQACINTLAACFARALLDRLALQKKRAQGRPGAGWHPRAPVLKIAHAMHRGNTGVAGSNPAFPAQWLYGPCRTLPGAEFIWPPSPREFDGCTGHRSGRCISARLGCSNGSQDHTVWPYAGGIVVNRGLCALTGFGSIHCPALPRTSAPTPPASTASQPAFATTYDRPFGGLGRPINTPFPNSDKENYFCVRGLTRARRGSTDLPDCGDSAPNGPGPGRRATAPFDIDPLQYTEVNQVHRHRNSVLGIGGGEFAGDCCMADVDGGVGVESDGSPAHRAPPNRLL